MTSGRHDLDWPDTLPGKEYGAPAGYDAAGDLVYVGIGDWKMHKNVIDRIEHDWDKVFGYPLKDDLDALPRGRRPSKKGQGR